MESHKQLFFGGKLADGLALELPPELARRLKKVLRLTEGDTVALFNGHNGLFAAQIQDGSCKEALITHQLAPQKVLPEVHLYIGLLKKEAMDKVLRQAVELGVTDIHPVLCDFSVPNKLNTQRVEALIIEAAEQCERMSLPTVHPLRPLNQAMEENNRPPLFWCNERANHAAQTMAAQAGEGLLVGPEGGFSEAEVTYLNRQPNLTTVSLGGTILRADTAVVAALSRFYLGLVAPK